MAASQELLQSFQAILTERAGAKCELCSAAESLQVVEIPHSANVSDEQCAYLCPVCAAGVSNEEVPDNHWFCLQESAWSQVPAIQVLAYRLLHSLNEDWAKELFDQIYLDDDVRSWAEAGLLAQNTTALQVKDSNGTLLQEGDTVTIIKDLEVKGAGFVAKRGTVVRNIHLGDDPDLIEGKVNKTTIFLRTEFLKKS